MTNSTLVRTVVSSLATFVALVVFCTVALNLNQFPSSILQSDSGSVWKETVNISSNALFLWRDGPVSQLLMYLSGNLANANLLNQVCLVSSLIFGLGTAGILIRISSKTFKEAFCIALVLASLIPLTLGFDPVSIAAISWMPFAVLALILVKSTSKRIPLGEIIFLTTVSCLLALSANQFAPILSLLAIAVAGIIPTTNFSENSDKVRNSTQVTRYLAYLIVLAPAFYTLFSIPGLNIPQYPSLAHVVPDDNIPGHISALIGPSSNLQIIDRSALKQVFSPLSLALLAFGLVVFISGRKTSYKRLAFLALSLLLIAALDILFSEEVAQISPLASLSRVIPGLFYLSLAPICLLAGLFICMLSAPLAGRSLEVAAGASIVVLLGMFSFEAAEVSTDKLRARFNKEYRVHQLASELPEYSRARLVSPSLRLISEYKARPLKQSELFTTDSYVSLPTTPKVLVSGNQQQAQLMLDGKNDTAWNSGASSQSNNEWLLVTFADLLEIDGIELATGALRWDFPRGIEISTSKSCIPPDNQKFTGYTPVVEDSSWQGRVRFTESGLPYYGGQDEVKIVFPETVKTHCLLIRQTGSHPHFRWSVAELRFLMAREFT